MTKFKDTFRIESVRFLEWDYASPWWYYVTTNTKDHVEYFGIIENEKMVLNELGKIVEEEWLKTKELRANVQLDYFVVMPNHIHGIVIIRDIGRAVARNGFTEKANIYSKISPAASSLSAIIRSFKSALTKRIHEIGYSSFFWQSRFYDRIIRNEKELFNIRKYIEQNPLKWNLEKNNQENICEL